MIKPLLLFAYGNLSRGDDALGLLLLDFVGKHFDLTEIEMQSDFQLQIEHALDLENHDLVLFADASVACPDNFEFTELKPAQDSSYTTHAMSPSAVMAVYQSIQKRPPPPSFMLAIKGYSFELGETLSCRAEQNLIHACRFVRQLLETPQPGDWRKRLTNRSIANLEPNCRWPESTLQDTSAHLR